ncbi:MAG: sensor histidine kinase, partial [Bacteroidota bacterium]
QLVVAFRQHHDFSTREMRVLASLAEKSSVALANARLYENLRLHEKELELLSGARIVAQEEERRRIAREIHDGLGQILTAIKFNIEILEDTIRLNDEERKRVEDVKSLLDGVMTEAREISYNLMPSILDDFGLAPAVQHLCEQTSTRTGLKIRFQSHGLADRLHPSLETGLYRIIQEALNNITKHAEATTVEVQLIGTPASVRMMVEDDGKGIPAADSPVKNQGPGGMGLVGMRERVSSFRGTFHLESRPGHGTEIHVEIPLTDNGHETDSHFAG